ncbi:hypothetical protein BVX98_01135 [bacterium F11]|nr:hypothetical protein BVX98_01135 [bacterium F11]
MKKNIPLILSLFLFVPPLMSAPTNDIRPNIIVIVVDTLRADYLGCYGFKGDISSNIDRFADSSVRFTRCIVNSPWTKPSVASLFTSLDPQTHRVTDHLGMHWKKVSKKVKSSVLSEEAVTLAEVLQGAGYDTVGLVANDFLIRRFGYQQGFNQYYEPRPNTDVFSATPLLNKALRLIRKGKIRQPFFLYLHFMDVHGPYQCQGEDFSILSQSPSLGEDQVLTKKQRKKIPHELGYRIPWRGSKKAYHVRNWRNCYAAGVRKFDRRLGPFLKSIEEMGLLENSTVVLTSDHGEELFDHGSWAHGHTLFSELLNVPLLIRLPGTAPKKRVINETVSWLDIMPTLMQQAGITVQMPDLAGRDITPLLNGKSLSGTSWAFATATRRNPNVISAQNNRFKLIWNHPRHQMKLFDMNKDSLEKKNLVSKRPKILDRFKRRINAHLKALKRKGNLLERTTVISDHLLEKLKSLGYLQ